MQLTRQVVFELVQALKFKNNIPDENMLTLVGIVLQDAGGELPEGLVEGLPQFSHSFYSSTNNAAECMRQYLNDILDFLADFHTLTKIKVCLTWSLFILINVMKNHFRISKMDKLQLA